MAVMLVFFLAGTVKGVVGFGLPLVSISLLTPLYGLVDAVGLMLIPAIVTNFWQAVSGDRLAALWRRLWTLLAPAMVFTWLAANVLAQVDTRWFTVLLGIVIFTYSLAGLTSWQLPEPGRREKWLSPVIGIISGVLTGLTGVAVFPFVTYLHAIRLDWQALFQVMGVWFLVASSIYRLCVRPARSIAVVHREPWYHRGHNWAGWNGAGPNDSQALVGAGLSPGLFCGLSTGRGLCHYQSPLGLNVICIRPV